MMRQRSTREVGRTIQPIFRCGFSGANKFHAGAQDEIAPFIFCVRHRELISPTSG